MVDVQASYSPTATYQIESDEDAVTAFDISQSGEVLGFGDAGGFLHQWADREDIKANTPCCLPCSLDVCREGKGVCGCVSKPLYEIIVADNNPPRP